MENKQMDKRLQKTDDKSNLKTNPQYLRIEKSADGKLSSLAIRVNIPAVQQGVF